MYTLKEPPKYFDVLGWFFIYLITEITRCSSPFKIPIEQFTSIVPITFVIIGTIKSKKISSIVSPPPYTVFLGLEMVTS